MMLISTWIESDAFSANEKLVDTLLQLYLRPII